MSEPNRREFIAAAASAAAVATTPVSSARAARLTQHKTRLAVNLEMTKLGKTSFLDRLDIVAEYGFPAIEFWPHTNKDILALVKKKNALKLDVSQFTATDWRCLPNNPKNHEKFVAQVAESCEVAHKLDCKLLTVLAGQTIKHIPHDVQTKNVIEGLKRAGEVAAKNDITLILEPLNTKINHKGHFLSKPAHAAEIITGVDNPHVKLLWDIYHMQITEGNIINTIKANYAHIAYFQIADNPGRHEPGTGEINYNNVLKALYEFGYRGYVGMEFSPSGDWKAALAAAVESDVW